jgi:carboxypeptidase C (cathepsin A)
VDNEYSILDIADVVFIDPVATGYSRMLKGQDPHKFHGTLEDIQSLAEFIRLFVSRNQRWESPKFIIGESYGTVRASGLAGYLTSEHSMYLNGVILVSMTSLDVDTGGDVGFALILPHYTATAWYHKKLSADLLQKPLREVLDESEAFAMNDYLAALAKGGYVPDAEKSEVVARLARYTGLSEKYVENSNLRIERSRFRKELLRNEGRTVGRLDSRYVGIDREAAGATNEYDPAIADWEGTFAGAINHYLSAELNYYTDLEYHMWGDVRPWRRDSGVHVGEMLHGALTENRYMKVFITEGYYDAACDYFTAQYVFSHLDLNGEFRDRISFGFYESGHMMYCHLPSLQKMKKDLSAFINSALPE